MNEAWNQPSMMSEPSQEVRSASFFSDFCDYSNRSDMQALAGLFADSFLAAGQHGSQPVRRADFLAILPKRYERLRALGCRDSSLTSLREMQMGPLHLWVTTEWRMERADAEPGKTAAGARLAGAYEPIRVTSTFLLEKDQNGWRIVLYLAHDDLEALLREAVSREEQAG